MPRFYHKFLYNTDVARIYLAGGGAREHEIGLHIVKYGHTPIFGSPKKNEGLRQLGRVGIIPPTSPQEHLELAQKEHADVAIIGREDSLQYGIVDVFQAAGIPTLGPRARVFRKHEGSKLQNKAFMRRHGIRTAAFENLEPDKVRDARKIIERFNTPIVTKEDPLRGGKGVSIHEEVEEAIKAAEIALRQGTGVVVEEYLRGFELSLMGIVNGSDGVWFPESQDSKLLDGKMTGGMGAYAPLPFIDAKQSALIHREMAQLYVEGMVEEGDSFTGVYYPNIMMVNGVPYLLEPNLRPGDPETEVLIPLLDEDLVEIVMNVINGSVKGLKPKILNKYAVAVVLSQRGYPDKPIGNPVIEGIEHAEQIPDVKVLHAGTTIAVRGKYKGKLVAVGGGRNLTVRAVDDTLEGARDKAYHAVSRINFDAVKKDDIAQQGIIYLRERDIF